MACTATVAFGSAPSAQFGAPTNFMVTVTNNTGSDTNILSMQPIARRPRGGHATSVNVGPIIASPELGLAQVGGSQFNVPLANGSSISFPFQIQFFGPAISGGPTQPIEAYLVDCIISTSDGSSFACNSPLNVNLNQPQFGKAPGSPPNPSPVVGQLGFQAPANAVLAL